MPLPTNHLKAALAANLPQIGIWLSLASPYSSELLADVGFDWLLIDAEHGPNDIPTILAQAQTIGAHTSVVVRPPVGEAWMIKQILDLGVQTLMVPMIESVDQAKTVIAATLYPPHGVRGVGAASARASNFGRLTDYVKTANDQVCLILQVESRAGLAALPGILQLENVDCVFVGPADLAADMGFPGESSAPAVQSAIDGALLQIVASGKAAGILTFDRAAAAHYLKLGVTFVGVGSDVALLAHAASNLAADIKGLTAGGQVPRVWPHGQK